jgi:hypothetical protein
MATTPVFYQPCKTTVDSHGTQWIVLPSGQFQPVNQQMIQQQMLQQQQWQHLTQQLTQHQTQQAVSHSFPTVVLNQALAVPAPLPALESVPTAPAHITRPAQTPIDTRPQSVRGPPVLPLGKSAKAQELPTANRGMQPGKPIQIHLANRPDSHSAYVRSPNNHASNAQATSTRKMCNFFLTRVGCRRGIDCPFSHKIDEATFRSVLARSHDAGRLEDELKSVKKQLETLKEAKRQHHFVFPSQSDVRLMMPQRLLEQWRKHMAFCLELQTAANRQFAESTAQQAVAVKKEKMEDIHQFTETAEKLVEQGTKLFSQFCADHDSRK